MRNKSNLVAAMVVMKKKYLLCCCMLVVMINITRGSLIPYHIYGDAFASTEFVLPPDIYPVPHWDSDSYDLTSNAPISCGITIYEMWTDYGYGPFEATSSAGNFSVTTSVNAEQAYRRYWNSNRYLEQLIWILTSLGVIHFPARILLKIP